MNEDYTPGHAYKDIAVVVPQINHEYMNACLRRLYKSGQANERTAIVAGLSAKQRTLVAAAEEHPDSPFLAEARIVAVVVGLIERGDVS